MNNEPVAYVDNVWIGRPDLARDLGIGQMFSRCQLSDHQIPLYTHPAKTLTDEEILCLWDYWSGEILAIDILDFADKYRRAILNEEAIIEWHQEYCKKMNEEDAKKVDTYKSQNNNQIDTYRYKNLTDEEIDDVGDAVSNLIDTYAGRREFARAILKKASEK